MFDRVIVAVLKNMEKEPLFTVPERVEMLREVTKQWPSVEVDVFQGLLVDYARKRDAAVIPAWASREPAPLRAVA